MSKQKSISCYKYILVSTTSHSKFYLEWYIFISEERCGFMICVIEIYMLLF